MRVLKLLFALVLSAPTLLGGAACGSPQAVVDPQRHGNAQIVARLDRMPSGVAVFGERIFLSLPRWVEHGNATLVELVDGRPVPWPPNLNQDPQTGPGALTSVNGIRIDARGRMWVLDNGRVDLAPAAPSVPKVVVLDVASGRELFRHTFSEHVAGSGSFLNDIAIDLDRGVAYLTDTAPGGSAALVVLDIGRDIAWRVLDGHPSLQADPDEAMTIRGEVATQARGDAVHPWRVGANAIALSLDGDALYYGPMTGRTLWEVPSVALRDVQLRDDERAAQVVAWSPKPITDGITMRADGTLLLTDIENNAIVAIDPEDALAIVALDPAIDFPVAIDADATGAVWFTSSQLHRMPLLLAGQDRRRPPYLLWRATHPLFVAIETPAQDGSPAPAALEP